MAAAEGPLGGPSLVSLSPSPSPLFASEPSQKGPSHGLPGPAAFLEAIRWRRAHAGLYGLLGSPQGLFFPWGLLRDERNVFSPNSSPAVAPAESPRRPVNVQMARPHSQDF